MGARSRAGGYIDDATAVVRSVGNREPGAAVRGWLADYGTSPVSVAALLCDRHPTDRVAVTVVDAALNDSDWTYGELGQASQRLAGLLGDLGVGPGDRVATLMGKSAELVATLLAIWRLGAVHVPLFTAFDLPAIAFRLRDSGARVVVCDDGQRPKLDASPELPTDPSWVVVTVTRFTESRSSEGAGSGRPRREVPPVAVGGEAPFIHLYTSGTTGDPKGVVVPVKALAGFRTYLVYGLDLRPEDAYWNAADPGWAYGLFYSVIGPLLVGQRTLLLDAPFSAELSRAVLESFGITNFAAAPTVYRALRAGEPRSTSLSLRCASSAGEPLNAEVVEWARRALGAAVHDHYGQSELGMVIGNHHHPAVARPLQPNSMGQPLPGWSLEVLAADREEPAEPGTFGRLAVDVPNSPLLWFEGYSRNPQGTAERFTADGRWYLTGDSAVRDAHCNFFYRARDDDVIVMAGHRIGPFEVESVLITHPAVAEVAVVGVPDDLRGEVLEAFVVLRPGHLSSDNLEQELQGMTSTRCGVGLRDVHRVDALPRTSSGKVKRQVLRSAGRRSGLEGREQRREPPPA